MKQPVCKHCGSTTHYSFKCFKAPKKVKTKNIFKPTYSQIDYRKQLIADLDKVFSEYIRLRDSVEGYITCITCGDKYYWLDSDNCHYISRGKLGTRFSEINCNAGCRHCNRYLGGNLDKYKAWLIDKHGENIIDLLKMESHKTLTTVELYDMLNMYQDKLIKLYKLKAAD